MNVKLIIATVFILLGLISCTPSRHLRSTKSWYKPKPSLISADYSTLKGKTIMLDPGHGNRTSGAVGIYGTKERDVNLAVAVSLKKLLEEHGAAVLMTRETDTTVLWSSNISARDDLGFRCHYRDSVKPDLFISLHHNGSEDGSRDENGAKTFYALGDEGGSLDLASCINHEFTKQLGLGFSSLQKGNYYVLRNPEVPSIIGEPSYLSHPVMEKILKDSSAVYLEAVAYFNGIISWFSQGVPKIINIKVEPIKEIVAVAIEAEMPLDSMLTGVTCDDEKLIGRITMDGFTAVLPSMLKNGVHTITCFAGNVNGNLATKKSIELEINRSPSSIHCSYGSALRGSIVPVYITVLDSLGLSVKDGTVVICDGTDTCIIADGNAIYYHYVNNLCDTVSFSCGSRSQQVIICSNTKNSKPFQGFIKSSDHNCTPVQCILEKKGTTLFVADRNGFISFNTEDTTAKESAIFISAKGFIDTNVMMTRGVIDTIKLSLRASGALFGKKIMIDPEFGGYEDGGISSTGKRACDITRKVATCIASQLELYGAQVVMARSEDQTIHVTERVVSAQKNNVDFYILVRSDSVNKDPYLIYSPGSVKGQKAAECFSKYWNKESKVPVKIFPKVEYVILQTECPAIDISLSPVGLPESTEPQRWHFIARTVVDGLIEYYLKSSIE